MDALLRALARGELKAGDEFPSVRELSRQLKINPNTAHKVVQSLVREGLLEVLPGLGTRVAERPKASVRVARRSLEGPIEALVVEAINQGVPLETVQQWLAETWARLGRHDS